MKIQKYQNPAGKIGEELYKQIEEIAKYNIENGTNFYKMDQVKEHQKAKSRLQQSQAIYDETDPFSIGDDVRAAYISAGKRPETIEDQKKIDEWDASAKATNLAGLSTIATLPLIGEFTTYGLLGGLSRIAGGFEGSALGSYGLGKVGDYADSKLGTNWIGNTGRIIGGFVGFGPGMNAGYKGALDFATMFPKVAKFGTTNRFISDVAGRALGKNITGTRFHNVPIFNSEFADNQLYDFLKTELTDPTQLVHVSPNLITESRFVENPNAAKLGFGPERLAAHGKGLYWVPGTSLNSLVNGQNKVWTFEGRPYRISPRDNTYIQIKQGTIPTEVTPQLDAFAHDKIPLSYASKIYQRNPITGWVDRVIVEPIPTPQSQQVKIPGTPFYRDVVPGSRPISIAERLGIPKGMRSNPKALEDVYYWGYPQWNQRYNAAIESGDMAEAQRLRDLHFKQKTLLEPTHYYHGTNTKFTQFDENRIGSLDPGWYGRGFYFSPDKNIAEGYASAQSGPNVIYDTFLNVKKPIYRDAGIWDDKIVGSRIPETNDGVFVRLGEPEIILDKSLQYNPDEIVEVVVPKANQIKLSNPITKTDSKQVIPIVKRDNFHNLDIRYKKGGILKAQNGLLTTWQKAYDSKFGKGLRDFMFGKDVMDLSDEEYVNKYGYYKPSGAIGIAGSISNPIGGVYNIGQKAKFIKAAEKYHGLGKEANQLYTAIVDSGTIPKGKSLSRLQNLMINMSKEGTSINKYELNRQIKHYTRLAEEASKRTQESIRIADKYITTPSKLKSPSKSIQKIVNSDFEPFDQTKTLWQTGSRAKTTSSFKLSDYYKQGGIIKAQNGLGKIPVIGPIAKNAAYKVITEPDVWFAGGATSKSFIKSLFTKNEEDDNKRMFIFGVDRPETTDGNAYTWQKDIDENGYKNVKSYKGILNPYNEYVFNARDRGLVNALADKNYSAVSNINDEYTDESGNITKETPYFDDVHGYRLTFHKDKNGNPVISASDLYDFGENYSKDYEDVYKERTGKSGKSLEFQRNLLNSVGQPYKLVQHNIPIRFTDNPTGNEIYRVNSITNQVLDKLSGEEIAKLTNAGYIKPAIIE